MASQTKDRGITIGVDIMGMSISWECSILYLMARVKEDRSPQVKKILTYLDSKRT